MDKTYLDVLKENLEASKRHQNKGVRKLLVQTYEDLISIWEANYAGKIWHPSKDSFNELRIRNGKCKCSSETKTGQTSVMCCNVCGLPDEDFWLPPLDRDLMQELDNIVSDFEIYPTADDLIAKLVFAVKRYEKESNKNVQDAFFRQNKADNEVINRCELFYTALNEFIDILKEESKLSLGEAEKWKDINGFAYSDFNSRYRTLNWVIEELSNLSDSFRKE